MSTTRKNAKGRIEKRQKEAIIRQEAYAKLTVPEKIAQLDKLFGVGLGAKKVRMKLAKVV